MNVRKALASIVSMCNLHVFLLSKFIHRYFTLFTNGMFRPLNVRSQSWVTVGRSVSQSVSMSWCRAHSGTCDQILLPVRRLLSESCGFASVGRPLSREDGSAVCSAITQWSEPRRTRNHDLLSHLRLLQRRGPGSRIYIPQEQGGPVILPSTGFPFRRLLRLAGLWWRYSPSPPPTWKARSPYTFPPGTGWSRRKSKSRYDRRPDIQYVLVWKEAIKTRFMVFMALCHSVVC
jgi:hypothetical protein